MLRQLLPVLLSVMVLPLAAADLKVGYVYSDQVMREYQGMTDPNTALARAKAEFRQRTDSLYQELGKAKSDFEAQRLLLSEEGRAAKAAVVEELQRQYDNYAREVYGPSGKLEQKTEELLAPVVQKIRDAVTKIATTEGYGIVFDASESKMAILYAVSGADLTRLVLEELDREFKPVTPTQVSEKRYAVLPLAEVDEEAVKDNMGEQCRALVYEFVRTQPRTQMVANAELNGALMNRGITGRANVGEQVAYQVGIDIQTDYIFYGTVGRTGKKTTVTLTVADPRLNKSYPSETNTANRPEDLRQTLGNMVLQLLRKLPQE